MRWRDIKQNKIPEKKEPKKSKNSIPYARIPDKIKAFITDTFLLGMPIFYIVIYVVMGDREGFAEHISEGWLYILVPLGIILTLFYIISGQTPGMKAYDIKVIDNKTGEKPDVISAILRFFFFNIVLFSFFTLFVSFFREDRRGLHDLFSGTSLIQISK